MSEAIQSEPSVGKQLPKKNFTVTDALLNDYFEGLDLERSNFDVGKAPVPTMIATDADNYFGESAFSQQRGHLWMRQEWTFSKPMQAGAHYQTEAHIEDIYKKRNRTLVNTAITMKDAWGDHVLTANHHQSFLLDDPVEQVEFREPSKKQGARKFIVPEGTPLEGFEKKNYLGDVWSVLPWEQELSHRQASVARIGVSGSGGRRPNDDGLCWPSSGNQLWRSLVQDGETGREVH
ncbi:MAG: hypothetical protein VB933_10460 [Pseudomonadales bacterium]